MALRRRTRDEGCAPRRAAPRSRRVLLRGIVEMTGDVLAAVADRLGTLDPATLERERAAWVEGAARRNRGEPRHRARDLREPHAVPGKGGDRAHQALGIGMQRMLHDVLHRA